MAHDPDVLRGLAERIESAVDLARSRGIERLEIGGAVKTWADILASLRSATGDGGKAKEPYDYEVIGTTYDDVKVLRSIGEPTNFTRDEIRAAVEAALQPRSTKIEGTGE
jgi:hypothetical protein